MRLPAACPPRALRSIGKVRASSWMPTALALMLALPAGASQAPVALPAGASQALEGLLACRKIASDSARFACLDRESAVLAARMATPADKIAALGAPAAAGSPARASEPHPVGADLGAAPGKTSALDPVQTFGLPLGQILAREEAAQRAPRALDHIGARIALLASTRDGREIFTLDNRQVWEEVEPDGDLYAKPGEAVQISRGWLGSYTLSLKSRRSSKVKRLR